jgi:hypothetical protein
MPDHNSYQIAASAAQAACACGNKALKIFGIHVAAKIKSPASPAP